MAETTMELLLELRDEVSGKLRGVQQKVEGFGKSISSIGTAANFVGGALTGMISAFSIIEIGRFIKRIGESADQLLDLSEQLNISTTSLQEWKNVMIATGSESDLFEKSIVKLTEVIGAAEGGFPKALKALKLIGPEFIKLVESGAPVPQIFEEALAIISKMESPTQRAAAIIKIFGREFLELVNIANEGTEAIVGFKAEGSILSEEDLIRARELNTRFNVLVNTIGVDLKGAILSAIGGWQLLWKTITNAPDPDLIKRMEPSIANKGIIVEDNITSEFGGSQPRHLVDKASESAAKSAAAKAAKDAADALKVIADLRKAIIDLQGGLDPLYAETVRLAGAETLLTTALKEGIITEQRAQEIRELLKGSTIAAKNAAEALEEVEKNRVALNKEAAQVVEENLTLEEQRAVALTHVKTLLDATSLSQNEYNKAVKRINLEYDELIKKADMSTDTMTEFAKQAAHNMEDAFSSFFFDIMQGNFTDLVGNFKRTIDKMVANLLASKLLGFLLGDFGTSGNLGGLAGQLFAGARQKGGPVVGGRSYLVGEAGPEMFVPDTSGSVQRGGAVGGQNVTINIKAWDTQDVRRGLESNKRWLAEVLAGTTLTHNLKARGV